MRLLVRGRWAGRVSTRTAIGALPSRVNAGTTRSVLPTGPICGAIDLLSGAVCTQPVDHPGVLVTSASGAGGLRTYPRFATEHVDASDPLSLVVWPHDEHTIGRQR